jgi:hypothetical protein
MEHKVLLTNYDLMQDWISNDKGKARQRIMRWRNRAEKVGLPRMAGATLRDRVYALLRNDRRKPKEEVNNLLVFRVVNHAVSTEITYNV